MKVEAVWHSTFVRGHTKICGCEGLQAVPTGTSGTGHLEDWLGVN
jgi:hypothetical protein